MAILTNKKIIDAIVQKFPTFQGHVSKDAYQLMTAEGYGALNALDPTFKNDFYGLLVRVWLNIVDISHAKDTLDNQGFGEYYDQPYGGITQRLSVSSILPINPGWKGLKNGDAPDPFVVRKPELNERFFKINLDYASLVTVPDDFQLRNMYISEYGISETMAGVMEGLRNGYTTQKYLQKIECLNAMINNTDHPLLATQQVSVEMTPDGADATDAQYKDFILKIKNIKSLMVNAPQTGAFNPARFESTQDASRLKLLVRPGLKNAISVYTLAGAFNPEELSLGIDVVEVPNFGGMIPYSDAEFTTRVYPVYGTLGEVTGYALNEGATTATLDKYNIYWQDPNEDVIAILADKGVVFETVQNPYEVIPIYNPRGRYTNYWASSPNNGLHYDYYYNYVVFKAEQPEPTVPEET